MIGFQHAEVVHMYGNKHFALVKADMSTSSDGHLVVNLLSKKRLIEKAPVSLTLSPADAVRLGAALIESGRSACNCAGCDCKWPGINS